MPQPNDLESMEQLRQRAEIAERNLRLLESAIRQDYDSILITELGLDAPGPLIVYVNDGFTRITGYSREEVIGKSPRILQGPKTDRAVLDKLKDALQKGHSFFGQTVNYRKDGSEFVNQWDIHPLENEAGEITHWVSYQHDITTKKKSEQSFLDVTLDSSDLYENSKKSYVDLDADGIVVQANKLFRDMVGYPKEMVTGRPIWDFLVPRQGVSLKEQYARVWADDLSQQNSIRLLLQHRNGSLIQVEISVKKVAGPQNKPVVHAEVTNLSITKRVMSVLNRKSLNYLKVFAQKTDFNYGMILDNNQHPRFKWVSDGFRQITGFGPEECLHADGLQTIVHPDDLAKAKSHLTLAFTGKSSCETYRIRCKDGSVVTVMDYAKPDAIEGITGSAVLR